MCVCVCVCVCVCMCVCVCVNAMQAAQARIVDLRALQAPSPSLRASIRSSMAGPFNASTTNKALAALRKSMTPEPRQRCEGPVAVLFSLVLTRRSAAHMHLPARMCICVSARACARVCVCVSMYVCVCHRPRDVGSVDTSVLVDQIRARDELVDALESRLNESDLELQEVYTRCEVRQTQMFMHPHTHTCTQQTHTHTHTHTQTHTHTHTHTHTRRGSHTHTHTHACARARRYVHTFIHAGHSKRVCVRGCTLYRL